MAGVIHHSEAGDAALGAVYSNITHTRCVYVWWRPSYLDDVFEAHAADLLFAFKHKADIDV